MLEPDENSSVDREGDNYNSGDNNSDVDLLKSSTEEDKLPSLKQPTEKYKPTQLQQNNSKKEISTTISSEKNKSNFSTSNRGNLKEATGYTSASTSSKANTLILPRNAQNSKIASTPAPTAAKPTAANSNSVQSFPQKNNSSTGTRFSKQQISAAAPSKATSAPSKVAVAAQPQSDTKIVEASSSPESIPSSIQSNEGLTQEEQDLILKNLPEKISIEGTPIKIKGPIIESIEKLRDKNDIDYILINAADVHIDKEDVNTIVNTKKTYINAQLKNREETKKQINKFIENPKINTRNISSLPKKLSNASLSRPSSAASLSRQSSAASSRPSTASLSASSSASSLLTTPLSRQSSAASLSESDCATTLGLMPELGDMRTIFYPPGSTGPNVNEIFKMLTCNKRFCYAVLREHDNNKSNTTINYLYNLIQILYFNANNNNTFRLIIPEPTINTLLQDISNVMKIFKIIDINLQGGPFNTTTRLLIDVYNEKSLSSSQISNIDKNLLITVTCKTEKKPCVNIRIPKIFFDNYVLVSYVDIDNKNVIMNDVTFVEIAMTVKKSIILNYQHMHFPPTDLREGVVLAAEKVYTRQSRFPPISGTKKGGKKTIRKYRKHNRNKTTRNYN